MMLSSVLLTAVLTVAPSDRLGLADRLFNRGDYAAAKTEYAALEETDALSADELLYRLAECERGLGNHAAALPLYTKLAAEYPASRHADRARLMKALASSRDEKILQLRALDSDRVEASIRASALYNLGELESDASAFERCVKLDPNGRYAAYARIRGATLLAQGNEPDAHRRAVAMLLEVAFGEEGDLADEALYLAASTSFADRRYSEAGSLLRRYLKRYPKGHHAEAATGYVAWCDYLTGRYADAIAWCGEGTTDDTAYILASAVGASGDAARAKALFAKYLEDHPQGRYRRNAELSLARLELDGADRADDRAKAVEAARRAVAISGAATDRLRLAWTLERAARTNEAETVYLGLATDEPGTASAAEALYRKAMIDIRAERWAAAEVALKESLAGKLDARLRADATYWRGVSVCRLGHPEEGTLLLKAAVAAGLGVDLSREARLIIADNEFNAGRQREAVGVYSELVREGASVRMSAAKALAVGRALFAGGYDEEAKTCARKLIQAGKPEWRQYGYALLGDVEAELKHAAASAEAYRRCVNEKCKTSVLPAVTLKYGLYLLAAGEPDAADAQLRQAVKLNGKNAEARASAYLGLAKAAQTRGKAKEAKGYATVVTTLFEKTASAPEAEKMLKGLDAAK